MIAEQIGMRIKSQTEIKKRRELNFFEKAHRLLPNLWPDGNVDSENENPDIIVCTSAGKYGIEVTEIMRESEKARESAEWGICERAQEKLLGSPILNGMGVHAAFKEGAWLHNKNKRRQAATELADIVRLHAPSQSNEVWRKTLEGYSDFDSEFFSEIWMHFHPTVPESIWQPSRAGWVPSLDADGIARRIAEKEPRLSAYRERAPRVFLLLVVYGFDLSSAAQISDEALEAQYHSDFDGIVLLDYLMDRTHELRIR